MYFLDLVGVVRRRWYVALLGLMLVAGLCVGAIVLVPTNYTSTASVLLLPPQNTLGTDGNPYRALGGLDVASDVLARAMTDAKSVSELAPQDGSATFVVEPDATSTGPILVMTTEGHTPAEVLQVQAAVLSQMAKKLRALQTDSGARPQTLIQLAVITQDNEAVADSKGQLRALVAALGVGLILTIIMTAGVDALARRRTSRRSERDQGTDSGSSDGRVDASAPQRKGTLNGRQRVATGAASTGSADDREKSLDGGNSRNRQAGIAQRSHTPRPRSGEPGIRR